MPRSRKLYLSEILKRCMMINSHVVIKTQKNGNTLWYDTVKNCIHELCTEKSWNKEVIYWHVVKAIEYIITIVI